jgi:hypothetical protein
MQDLSRYPFEWVLPGHGQRVHLPQSEMRKQMNRLVQSMSGPVRATLNRK